MQRLADLNGENYFSEGVVIVGDESTATVQITHISANTTVPVSNSDEGFANWYQGIGKGAAVDFSGYTGDINIDLNFDSDTATEKFIVGNLLTAAERLSTGYTVYESIVAVRGSEGDNSMIVGSKAAETIYAGSNFNTLDGGAGRDVLYGYDGASKHGSTDFVFNTGNGKDTIIGFEAYEGTNLVTADGLLIDYDSDSTVAANSKSDLDIKITNGNVRLSLNSNDQVTLLDMEDEVMSINYELYAIGNDLEYDPNVGHYLGADDATITVGDVEITEGVNIWMNLGGIEGLEEWGDYQDIEVLDVSDFYHDATLVGSLTDENVIYGGHGTNSMWGGGYGDDTLVAGEGANEYYYLTNNGNDVIVGAKDDEIVNLLGIDLNNYNVDSLIDAVSDTESTEIKFNDGGSVKVANGAAVQFKILGGHKWSIDRSNNTWTYRGQD